MAALEVVRETAGSTVTLRLRGHLDGTAAYQLDELLSAEAGQDVVLDFSHVKQFPDLTVGLLTQALGKRPVRLRGLCEHQARVFRYFGVTTVSAPAAAYYLPEDPAIA
jgi:anti-anti-sigma regulatory factor